MRLPIYDLDGVCLRLSNTFTLEIPKLTVSTGEVLCLVGPTGAGKSSLLRLLSGLEPPTSGQILLRWDRTIGVAPPSCHGSSASAAVVGIGAL